MPLRVRRGVYAEGYTEVYTESAGSVYTEVYTESPCPPRAPYMPRCSIDQTKPHTPGLPYKWTSSVSPEEGAVGLNVPFMIVQLS